MDTLETRLKQVKQRIAEAEAEFGRQPGSVTLLAVSKTWPAEQVREAALLGQRCFGENYLQEAVTKMEQLREETETLRLEWHYIGAIQSNKTQEIARYFDWVHSVDRLKIAKRLSDQRPEHLPPLNLCLQVNISNEASKSGCAPEQAAELAREIAALPRVNLKGLMAIPAHEEGLAQQRAVFHRLQKIRDQLAAQGLPLDTLSMGMSDDLEAAVAEGATIVRIGSAIFGPRNYTNI